MYIVKDDRRNPIRRKRVGITKNIDWQSLKDIQRDMDIDLIECRTSMHGAPSKLGSGYAISSSAASSNEYLSHCSIGIKIFE